MHKNIRQIYCLISIFILFGCNIDGNQNTSNGRLIVYNETDQTIEVQYTEETDTGFLHQEVSINANSQGIIFVYALFYDAEVTVIYDGISKVYDLDFRITETEELYVKAEDFLQ